MSQVRVCDPVVYVDRYGIDRPALVTNVFDGGTPEKYPNPSINVIFVSPNGDRTDQYGRQIEHETSVPHQSNQSAHGYKWRRVDEPVTQA